MFYRLGRLSCRHRRVVIAAWLALFLLSAPLIPRLISVLEVGGFSNPEIESARTRALLEEEIPSYSPSVLVVIFQTDDLVAQDRAFISQAELALSEVLQHPSVTGATSFTDNPAQIADDGHTAYTTVQLDLPPERAQRILPEIRDRLVDTELETTVAGAPAFFEDIERLSEQDLRRAEVIAIPFALVALLFVFGTVVGAAVPLVVGALSVATMLGMLYLVGQQISLSIFVLNLATMLGLGLAIDYSLFITSRFREELHAHDVETAAAISIDTAGRAIFFSGLTVMIGLSGLAWFDFMFLRSVGLAGLIVVGVSVIGALTLLPAVFGVVGPRIESLRITRAGPADDRGGTFWVRLSTFVMDHPWRVFIPTMAFLILLGLPFLSANLSSPDASILPQRVDSRRGFDILQNEFGDSELSPLIIAYQTDGPITSPASLSELWDLTHRLAADERVMRIDSIVTLDPRLTLEQYQVLYSPFSDETDPFTAGARARLASDDTAAIFVYTRKGSNDASTKDLVGDIRDYSTPAGSAMLVDGGAAEIIDVIDRMYSEFPAVAGFIVGVTYLVLLVLFRSAVLPLKAILMNALSITASFGAVVFIFQQGHFDWLFRFDPLGYVEASQPIILFCILFGLSMDYEVFLLSRVRETYLETGDNRQSVAHGLQRSGRIITGAALIVVLVTASFVSAEIVIVKSLGLGIAIAILIDATIVRALLVPATMRLLGDLNWWLPGWVRRVLPRKEFAH